MTRRLLNCQRLLGMVVTMLCLLGIAAYSTMPRQEDPSFPYRAGMITVSYPGASAEAVERLVLRPLNCVRSKSWTGARAPPEPAWHWPG